MLPVRRGGRHPQDSRQRFDADSARPQQRRFGAGEVDDGRFDAVPAGAAVEDQCNRVAKFVSDVLERWLR